MTKKTHRTMRGREINMEELVARNEKTPAVGNIRVNARGDEINSDGSIKRSRNEIMAEYHKLNTSVPTEGRVPHSSDDIEDE